MRAPRVYCAFQYRPMGLCERKVKSREFEWNTEGTNAEGVETNVEMLAKLPGVLL